MVTSFVWIDSLRRLHYKEPLLRMPLLCLPFSHQFQGRKTLHVRHNKLTVALVVRMFNGACLNLQRSKWISYLVPESLSRIFPNNRLLEYSSSSESDSSWEKIIWSSSTLFYKAWVVLKSATGRMVDACKLIEERTEQTFGRIVLVAWE